MTVWLEIEAGVRSVEAIGDTLASDDRIVGFRYVDRVETYTEFTEHYADEPEILELVDPSELATSFVIQLAPDIGLVDVQGDLLSLPEVEAVEPAPAGLED